MQELLELEELGESVVWPGSMTSAEARQTIANFKQTVVPGDKSSTSTACCVQPPLAPNTGASEDHSGMDRLTSFTSDIKYVKPKKLMVTPRVRKCVSLSDYNTKTVRCPSPPPSPSTLHSNSGGASSSVFHTAAATAVEHTGYNPFDDPDAQFSEDSTNS